jgi:hypothetical protein
MRLEEVLPFARQGRKIRLKTWANFQEIENVLETTTSYELLLDNWEVEAEKKPKMKAYKIYQQHGIYTLGWVAPDGSPGPNFIPAPEYDEK